MLIRRQLGEEGIACWQAPRRAWRMLSRINVQLSVRVFIMNLKKIVAQCDLCYLPAIAIATWTPSWTDQTVWMQR